MPAFSLQFFQVFAQIPITGQTNMKCTINSSTSQLGLVHSSPMLCQIRHIRNSYTTHFEQQVYHIVTWMVPVNGSQRRISNFGLCDFPGCLGSTARHVHLPLKSQPCAKSFSASKICLNQGRLENIQPILRIIWTSSYYSLPNNNPWSITSPNNSTNHEYLVPPFHKFRVSDITQVQQRCQVSNLFTLSRCLR